MREIKFRAWKKETESMIDSSMSIATIITRYIRGFGLGMQCGASEVQQDDYTIMQFTGRKDTKGKDIYEGDVVIDRDMHGKVFCIEYRDDSEYVGFIPVELNKGERLSIFVSWNKLEVIGNIYEGYENNLPQKK